MLNENINFVHKELENIRISIKEICGNTDRFQEWYYEKDIRSHFLNQIDSILIFHNLNTKYYNEQISNINWAKKAVDFEDNSDYYSLLEGYIVYNRNALIFSLSSVVERYIRLILKAIDINYDINADFRKVRRALFKHLRISETSNEWKALSTLSNIRNTIHNNGVYSTIDKNIEILEYQYRIFFISFRNNEVHFNAKYELITFILVDILRLTTIINSSPLLDGKSISGNESFL